MLPKVLAESGKSAVTVALFTSPEGTQWQTLSLGRV